MKPRRDRSGARGDDNVRDKDYDKVTVMAADKCVGAARRCTGACVVLAALFSAAGASAGDGEDAAALMRRRTPVVDVFEAARGAVVNISATQVITQVYSPSAFDLLIEDLFAQPRPRRRSVRINSVGSGFVLHRDGYVVTNYHVVARTAERQVVFADQQSYDAEIVAADAQRDLAVLKIEAPAPLEPITLGRSDDLMVGETVVAIGNPLGYQHTVTAGVVSALDRTIPAGKGVEFEGLIQTDASINPGNSGGPLLNVLGELVGINTAIRADAQNIGFAIPVDQLRQLLPEMLAVERRYRFVVGIRLADGEPTRVDEVADDSPAHAAGVLSGDAVVSVDNRPIRGAIDYHIALIGRRAEQVLPMTLEREGELRRLVLTLAAPPQPDGAGILRSKFGIEAEPITGQLAAQLRLPRLRGLRITQIESPSPAAEQRIRQGSLLLYIGRHQVSTLEDAGGLLKRVEPGQRVALGLLQVYRQRLVRRTVVLRAR